MPAIPLPFVTFMVTMMLLVKLLYPQDNRYRPAVYFVACCAVLMLFSGLRWSYSLYAFQLVQPFVASILPPLAWYCFAGTIRQQRPARCLLPTALTVVTCLLWPAATDIALLVFYLGYGIALIRLAGLGPDAFSLTRLSEAATTAFMAFFSGALLCFSALVDLAIALDFRFFDGQQAAMLVAIAQCLLLPLLCLAVAFTARAPLPEPAPVPDPLALRPEARQDFASSEAGPESEFERERLNEICEKLERLIAEKALYLDSDLTLNGLARKSGIPARQISRAVNLTRSCNVSQWINGFRIERAKLLLKTSRLSVTQIMLEAGFATKSNFNREFLRLTGLPPGHYRRDEAESSASATESRRSPL